MPELIVLHYTAMRSAKAAIERLCDPAHEVSAHYLISGQGQVTHMVEEGMRAWHAGAGSWCGRGDVNSRSIGVELDNDGTSPFAAAQIDAVEDLLRGIMERWSIPAAGVIGHSDMAPGRKFDPGPRFDWARLARQELAGQSCSKNPVMPTTADAFCKLAWAAGYPQDADFETLLGAVRLRFRPWAKGPLDGADMALFPGPVL